MSESRPLDGGPGAEIALIGMAARVPGARDLESFWTNVRDGVESIAFFSDEELEAAGVPREQLRRANYVKAAGVIEDVDLFDAAFFSFTPREAEVTDPQHRIFLECAWEALEHAGKDPLSFPGAIAVYGGASTNGYLWLSGGAAEADDLGACSQTTFGNDRSFLTTRVSYKLNLRGPSIDVQTACSTSLVAIHLACQSLLSGECDVALAGGVSINPRKEGYLYQEGGIRSPDGHCRVFEARAKGTVVGNGVGIVVLRRLADALADGDRIHAVIKGSAVNNDGSAKIGYTAPSVDGQAAVIAEALSVAGVSPRSIGYVEAHGTGTVLGDPIEIASLTQAYGAHTPEKAFCAISGVKANIGHLDEAAGAVGLIKAVLALEHATLPPAPAFENPNPHIDFAATPFYVNQRAQPWPARETPRRAGVSAFGIGGTNAHVIIEEAPSQEPSPSSRPAQLLVLSARTESALARVAENLARSLKTQALCLADVAYTLQTGRAALSHRRILVCRNRAEAVGMLESADVKRTRARRDTRSGGVVFLFPGQGTQHVRMAAGLYRNEPVFREAVDRCSGILEPWLGLDLRSLLYPAADTSEDAARRLDQAALAQPALFTVEYALSQLWDQWGVRPEAMVGHSLGEYVAACLAGVFSLEDALGVVASRALMIQGLPPGAMLAVPLPRDAVDAALTEELSLAAVNAPSRCVVSGPLEQVEALERRFVAKGVPCARLRSSHAFHSAMVEPILEPFRDCIARVQRRPPRIPYVSSVTGTWITAQEATDPAYWVRHLREPVRLADAVSELAKEPDRILLEVGPGQTLGALIRQQGEATAQLSILASIPHQGGPDADVHDALEALGRLWLAGATVSWRGLHAHERRRHVVLPSYPFERSAYRLAPSEGVAGVPPEPIRRSGKKDMSDWFYVPSWTRIPLRVSASPEVLSGPGHVAVVFADHCGLGSRIAKRIEQGGGPVLHVSPGEEFRRLGERVYAIDPGRPQDYEALFQEVAQENRRIGTIVHLWGMTADAGPAGSLDAFDYAQRMGFYSLLFLARALVRHLPSQPARIYVVSNGIHAVTGDESLAPEKATVLGACKVIPQEHPNLVCRSVDLDRRGDEETIVDQLMAELAAPESHPVVAYRRRYRWVQTFEPFRIEEGSSAGRIRDGGVYLITGGLGRIGLVLGTHLARTARARLILTGRTPFPDRSEWERWRETHGEGDETSRKIDGLRAMEALGAEVIACQADVADIDGMKAVLRLIDTRFGVLHGLIHAAGVSNQMARSAIQDSGFREGDEQFRAKARGLLVLEQLLEGRELDFRLLCSSLASVLGGLGFGVYAGANQFMDSFVEARRRTGSVPWLSVNWDGWELCGDVGPPGDPSQGLQISSAEGIAVVQRLLSTDSPPQLVVSTSDLQARLEGWIQGPAKAGAACKENPNTPVRPRSTETAFVAPRDGIERHVADIWTHVLGVEVGAHDHFAEVGGDSLAAVNLVARLNEAFGVEIPLREFLSAPTVAGLARFLASTTRGRPAGPPAASDDVPALPDVLVPIRSSGRQPPFFWVHRAGGTVLCYQELARLLADRPAYALQPLNANGKAAMPSSIEEIATGYVAALRTVQTRGPYILGGASMGGTVAFEMAQQLYAAGQTVALLALLDTPGPGQVPPTPDDDLAALTCIAGGEVSADPAPHPDREARILAVLDRGGIGLGASRETRVGRALDFVRLFQAHVDAMRRYELRPYPGRITFFRAETRGAYPAHPEAPWGEVAGAGLDVHVVPGTHESMIAQPAVQTLADHLERCLLSLTR